MWRTRTQNSEDTKLKTQKTQNTSSRHRETVKQGECRITLSSPRWRCAEHLLPRMRKWDHIARADLLTCDYLLFYQRSHMIIWSGALHHYNTLPRNKIKPCSSAHSSPLMVFFFSLISFTAFTTSSSMSVQLRILLSMFFSEPSINRWPWRKARMRKYSGFNNQCWRWVLFLPETKIRIRVLRLRIHVSMRNM